MKITNLYTMATKKTTSPNITVIVPHPQSIGAVTDHPLADVTLDPASMSANQFLQPNTDFASINPRNNLMGRAGIPSVPALSKFSNLYGATRNSAYKPYVEDDFYESLPDNTWYPGKFLDDYHQRLEDKQYNSPNDLVRRLDESDAKRGPLVPPLQVINNRGPLDDNNMYQDNQPDNTGWIRPNRWKNQKIQQAAKKSSSKNGTGGPKDKNGQGGAFDQVGATFDKLSNNLSTMYHSMIGPKTYSFTRTPQTMIPDVPNGNAMPQKPMAPKAPQAPQAPLKPMKPLAPKAPLTPTNPPSSAMPARSNPPHPTSSNSSIKSPNNANFLAPGSKPLPSSFFANVR